MLQPPQQDTENGKARRSLVFIVCVVVAVAAAVDVAVVILQ